MIFCMDSHGKKHPCGFKSHWLVCTVFLSQDETIAYFTPWANRNSSLYTQLNQLRENLLTDSQCRAKEKFSTKSILQAIFNVYLPLYLRISPTHTKGHLNPDFWKRTGKEVAGLHWLGRILDIQLLKVSWKNPSLHLIWKSD